MHIFTKSLWIVSLFHDLQIMIQIWPRNCASITFMPVKKFYFKHLHAPQAKKKAIPMVLPKLENISLLYETSDKTFDFTNLAEAFQSLDHSILDLVKISFDY